MVDFALLSTELQPQLSSGSKIVGPDETVVRWDDSCSPSPQATVFPANEQDVATIVKFCRAKGLKCLAQSGGHSWRVRNASKIDVVICLRGLNKVEVAEDSKSVTLGGGTIVKELIDEVTSKGLETTTGVCNSVGALGSCLLGGLSRYMGLYGLGIDNLLSLNFVDATGKFHENVTGETDEDLWWAFRGAGSSLGIVTKATFKAHPQRNGGQSWNAALIFPDPSKLEQIIEVISEIDLEAGMMTHMLFVAPPPMNIPVILVTPWYYGSEEDAMKLWKPLFDLDPMLLDASMTTADKLNEGNDPFGAKGSRKPGVGLGLHRLDKEAYKQIWSSYVDLIKDPRFSQSIVLVERYHRDKTLDVDPDSTAYANRDINFEAICVPWYEEPELDEQANAWAASIRQIWVEKCSHPDGRLRAYPAFSGVNEPIESLFGEKDRIEKLRSIKQKWDPENYWDALISFA